jgi:poly(3-hydroxyalkanoate) depolymerase
MEGLEGAEMSFTEVNSLDRGIDKADVLLADVAEDFGTGDSRQADRVARARAHGQPRQDATGDQVRTLTVCGRVLRVAVRGGNPQWPPLLLCNGIGASLDLLQPFVDALDPRREVVRFDVPGIGRSPMPTVPYHLATMAPLMSGLLDQLGYQQADVLGISWGGGLAQHFAVECPARVRRLVLVATSPGGLMVPGHPLALLRMLVPRRHRDGGYAASIAGNLYGGSVRRNPALARELLHATTGLVATRGFAYQLLATAGWTSLPLLPWLRQPTLILAGDDDPIIPVINARVMHWLIPRSELIVYHGGHLDLITEARRLATIVEAFLTTETGPTARTRGGVTF